jgi:hypothetical protein
VEAVILIDLLANFCYLGKESLGEKLGEKICFVCVNLCVFSKKTLLLCNQKLMIIIIIINICKSPKKNFILRVLGSVRSLLL